MKLSNKLKITLLITFLVVALYNLKAFAVTGVITEITVNMRKEPSTSSKRIMYVTQDYKVEVLEKVGEWYKIKYKGVTGYVFGKYVDVDESKLEVKEENKVPQKEQNQNTDTKPEETNKKEDTSIQDITTDTNVELEIKEGTQLRLIPSITSNVIYTSKKVIDVEVIEQLGNWSYVYTDNTYGWIRTENIIEKNSGQDSNKNNEEETTENEVEITEREIAYIKYDTVNLRKKASTSSTVLAKLKLNNEVIIIEETSSKWTKVEYDGITGYVSADLLSSEKVKEKEETSTTSRDGETVSRDEEEKEEVVTDTIVKEENTTKEELKDTTTNAENKKEDVDVPVSKEEDKETSNNSKEEDSKETENKKEETNESSKNDLTTSKTKGEEIVEYAKQYLGYKYVLGCDSPKTGFDCSGLTSYVYKQFGYTLSRTSTLQAKNGKEVSKSDLQPGDLLIFKNQELTRIGHVGIYIGNNKMIHASEPGVGVVITDLDARGYNYNKRFVTARRIID